MYVTFIGRASSSDGNSKSHKYHIFFSVLLPSLEHRVVVPQEIDGSTGSNYRCHCSFSSAWQQHNTWCSAWMASWLDRRRCIYCRSIIIHTQWNPKIFPYEAIETNLFFSSFFFYCCCCLVLIKLYSHSWFNGWPLCWRSLKGATHSIHLIWNA